MGEKNGWSFENSNINYRKFLTKTLYKIVMYSYRLCVSYCCDHEHTSNFEKQFSWLISKKVYLPLFQFSNGMITSELNNRQSKTNVANMSTPP